MYCTTAEERGCKIHIGGEVMALFNFPSGGQTAAGKGSIREDLMGNINIVKYIMHTHWKTAENVSR